MATGARVIIYTPSDEYLNTLRHNLLGIPGCQIVAEIDDTVMLAEAVDTFSADVAVVDLDPHPDEALPVAGALAMEKPGVDVFAVSESSDGQLILGAMRAGIREFLTKPIDLDLLTIALERVSSRKKSDSADGKIISVLGSSGGVGSSVVTCNLAVELCDIVGDGRVALVDMDYRFGQLATLLDMQPSFTIADLVDTTEQLEISLVERAMTRHESGVHVLARPNHFAQADLITAAHCAGVLHSLQGLYDYVLVDGPNRFDAGGKTILNITDQTVLLIQLLVTSVRNVHRIVGEMRDAGFNLDRVKLVCNRVGKESGSISPEYVEETLDHKIFHFLPDEWGTVSGAINMGVPLIKEYGKTRIRAAIRELAEKIHARGGAPETSEQEKRSGGLFSKMFHKG